VAELRVEGQLEAKDQSAGGSFAGYRVDLYFSRDMPTPSGNGGPATDEPGPGGLAGRIRLRQRRRIRFMTAPSWLGSLVAGAFLCFAGQGRG